MKLTDLLNVKPESSPIALPCEVTPGHMTKAFVIVSFEKVMIVGGETHLVRVELRTCPACFGTFAYDVAQIARDIHGRN